MAAPYSKSFDEVATTFADYGQTVRGFVRYKVVQQNLEPFIKGKKLRVLDIGGGSGPDAGWLAQQGHSVTLLEPSKKQLEYAQRRFNFFLSKAARQRIHTINGSLDDAADDEQYDLVIIHGVAMYQDDPAAFIAQAATLAKPGGLISLLEKGYYGAESQSIRRRNFKQLRTLRATKRYVNSLGQEVWSFLPEELERILTKQAKTEVVQWGGIRLMTDDMTTKITELTPAELSAIADVEATQGANPAIRGQGQMLHFIARKNKNQSKKKPTRR